MYITRTSLKKDAISRGPGFAGKHVGFREHLKFVPENDIIIASVNKAGKSGMSSSILSIFPMEFKVIHLSQGLNSHYFHFPYISYKRG